LGELGRGDRRSGQIAQAEIAEPNARIIHHQVKLEYSSAIDPTMAGAYNPASEARHRPYPGDSPSLRREVSRLIEKETPCAVQLAMLDLEEHGEFNQMELPTISTASYAEEQVLGDWFPEEPSR
jgi:hypothetical protein